MVRGSGLVAGDIEAYNANYYNVYCDMNALKSMLQKEYAGRAIPGQPTTKTGKPYRFFAYSSAMVQADDIDHVESLAAEIQSKGYKAIRCRIFEEHAEAICNGTGGSRRNRRGFAFSWQRLESQIQ